MPKFRLSPRSAVPSSPRLARVSTNATEPIRGRRAANKSRLRQRLLDAVEQELEHGTYAELSIERLLERSGVARSTFYYNFDDKAELIGALAEDVFEIFEDAALHWMSDTDAMTKDNMRTSTEQLFRVYWEHRTVMIAAADSAAGDARIRARLDRMWSNLAQGVADRIIIAQEKRHWRDTDPQRTAAWLIWMTERGLYDAARHADEDELMRLATVHTDICWTALAGSD
jgi:TetR/AcrR family transcriptional regulator, ethionamide resistance regulator